MKTEEVCFIIFVFVLYFYSLNVPIFPFCWFVLSTLSVLSTFSVLSTLSVLYALSVLSQKTETDKTDKTDSVTPPHHIKVLSRCLALKRNSVITPDMTNAVSCFSTHSVVQVLINYRW